MYSENKRNFDVFSLVIGILLIFLGGYSLYRPDTTLAFISIMIGIIAIIKGIYELWFRRGISFWLGEKSGWLLAMGILDIILGCIFIFKIAVGASFIAIIFAIWFIFDALTQLATANFFKRLNKGYYWIIVVLSILGLVAVTAIENRIKKSRYNSCKVQETNLIEGAKMVMIDYPNLLPTSSSSSVTIPVSVLQNGGTINGQVIDSGYIEKDLINPMTDKSYVSSSSGVSVRVTTTNGTNFDYTVVYGNEDESCHR